jgi:hypothetical protein
MIAHHITGDVFFTYAIYGCHPPPAQFILDYVIYRIVAVILEMF